MALLGRAAVAMWWDIESSDRSEFENWHSREHFPERMGIPGFRRGSRWRSGGGAKGFFVMYELDTVETFASDAYFARLNSPTPWSVKMMPKHRNMIRSVCRVVESRGGGLAAHMATIRLSPRAGEEEVLERYVSTMLDEASREPGITSVHFLRNERLDIAPTTEQRIRGGDGTADRIVLISGFDAQAIERVSEGAFRRQVLQQNGAEGTQEHGKFELSYTFTEQDLTAIQNEAVSQIA